MLELQNEKIDNILNMTFLQCLEHYGGIKYYLELEGMTTFEEEEKKNMEEEFIFHFEEQLKSFKEILDKKIEKKRKIEFDTMKTENSLRIDSINSESIIERIGMSCGSTHTILRFFSTSVIT